jgi:hypothetical protein
MIFAEATPFGAGVILWGDYNDLRSLYDTVSRIADAAPDAVGDFMYGLSYNIRHAYEHQREEKVFGRDDIDKVMYLGERILWPHVLAQVSLVRYHAAFVNTSKEDQANIYRLEHALEQALRNYDAEIGETCAEWLATPFHASQQYLAEYFDELAHRYVDGPAGKRRFKKLPAVLRSMSEVSPEYRAFKTELEKIAKEHGCEVDELSSLTEFPEFRW